MSHDDNDPSALEAEERVLVRGAFRADPIAQALIDRCVAEATAAAARENRNPLRRIRRALAMLCYHVRRRWPQSLRRRRPPDPRLVFNPAELAHAHITACGFLQADTAAFYAWAHYCRLHRLRLDLNGADRYMSQHELLELCARAGGRATIFADGARDGIVSVKDWRR